MDNRLWIFMCLMRRRSRHSLRRLESVKKEQKRSKNKTKKCLPLFVPKKKLPNNKKKMPKNAKNVDLPKLESSVR